MAYHGVHRVAQRTLTFGTLLLTACPNQELAPLVPCTIASASIDAAQTGVDKVDVLFVVDNSGSMAEEQVKLSKELPRLVQVLASGDLDGVPNPDGQLDFTPVSSLHLGVVSTDLGVNGQTNILSCGNTSFEATDQDTTDRFMSATANKPHGDEGKLLSSAAVALSGVSVRGAQVIAPRPECADVSVARFIDFQASKSNAAEVARQFGCVAQLGVNGCGYEQQLESMWRALAASTDVSFSRGSSGQGGPSGFNTGFLRDDAVLVVILVSDEEDCSSPDANASSVYVPTSNSAANVLCARNAQALHQVQRYIAGLRSLKSAAYQDRIIFAGIVGVPTADQTAEKSLDEILASPAMQVMEEETPEGLRVRPSCLTGDGRADPARRIVEVAKGFGKNGVITSICEADYGPALSAVIAKIAEKLTGACLPRQLKVNSEGMVECRVLEIKAADDRTPCAQTPGRSSREIEDVDLGDGKPRVVCEVHQLPVNNATVPQGLGWYYDNFSADATKRCTQFKQRVAFAQGSPLSTGALAKVVCQQTVLNADPSARGMGASNTPCTDSGNGGPKGDALCQMLSVPPNEVLLCVQGTCQLSCTSDAGCPPGFTCTADALGRGYCANPTCPISEEGALPGAGATVPAGS